MEEFAEQLNNILNGEERLPEWLTFMSEGS